jgi:hypothetical protein
MESLELGLISTLRDDRLRDLIGRYLPSDLIVEDIARVTFQALMEANCSDLSVIRSSLARRIVDGSIVNDVMEVLRASEIPLTDRGYISAREQLINYIRSRRVCSQLSYLQELDFDQQLSVKPAVFTSIKAACEFDVVDIENDSSAYRFYKAEDLVRARKQALPLGEPIKSSFGLINEVVQAGGHCGGTLSTFVGPPGVGKSTGLVQESVAAIKQGAKVLHYVMGDLKPLDLFHRYTANFLKLPIGEISQREDELQQDPRIQAMFSQVTLVVKAAHEWDISDVYSDAIERSKSFNFQLVILDYDGNLGSISGGDLYREGGHVYATLDRLGKATGSAILVGCQPKIGEWQKHRIELGGAAESAKKQHISDLVLTMSRPEGHIPLGQLNVAKNRRGANGTRYILYLGAYATILEISSTEHAQIKSFFSTSIEEGEQRLMEWAQSRFGDNPTIGGKADD